MLRTCNDNEPQKENRPLEKGNYVEWLGTKLQILYNFHFNHLFIQFQYLIPCAVHILWPVVFCLDRFAQQKS